MSVSHLATLVVFISGNCIITAAVSASSLQNLQVSTSGSAVQPESFWITGAGENVAVEKPADHKSEAWHDATYEAHVDSEGKTAAEPRTLMRTEQQVMRTEQQVDREGTEDPSEEETRIREDDPSEDREGTEDPAEEREEQQVLSEVDREVTEGRRRYSSPRRRRARARTTVLGSSSPRRRRTSWHRRRTLRAASADTVQTTPAPIPCRWDQWQPWSDCTVSCGTGDHERSRDIRRKARNGGDQCQGPAQESESCNQDACPTTTTTTTTTTTKVETVAQVVAEEEGKIFGMKTNTFYLAAGVGGAAVIGGGALFYHASQKPKAPYGLDEFGEPIEGDLQQDDSQNYGQY